jgi:outer membrane protein OmpA-like peptidoglycan-associated protein
MALPRPWLVAIITLLPIAAPRRATAEPLELGGFFGPRFFSDDAEIGAKDDFRTTLETGFTVGPRLARSILPWLTPEIELPLSAARTVDLDVSVLWVEPRAHARLMWPRGKARPFAVLGFGVPMTASTKRGIFGSDVSIEGYGGFGGIYSPGRGLSFRLDLRVGVTDGYQAPNGDGTPVAVEVELSAGLYIELEGGKPRFGKRARPIDPRPGDEDGDHIADAGDSCPDRPEDEDGFEDRDGCPEIDNDLDQILDIADACPSVPESYNGFEDDDGCQDTLPQEIRDMIGTVEGLAYQAGSVEVPGKAGKALDQIAAVLKKFPATRIILVGHTDDREAEIEPIEDEAPEETAQRQADALAELGKRRADAIREALVDRDVPRGRIDVIGRGAEESASDNDTPRSRGRNRRVEVRLYVPTR